MDELTRLNKKYGKLSLLGVLQRIEELEAQLAEANERAEKAAQDGWLRTAETQLARAKEAEAQLDKVRGLVKEAKPAMFECESGSGASRAVHFKSLAVPVEQVLKALQQSEIDRLNAQLDKYKTALEKLARLGNGDHLGNSDGNMIARKALQEIRNEDR